MFCTFVYGKIKTSKYFLTSTLRVVYVVGGGLAQLVASLIASTKLINTRPG